MKPSSANFRHYLGSDGVRRKEWQNFQKIVLFLKMD